MIFCSFLLVGKENNNIMKRKRAEYQYIHESDEEETNIEEETDTENRTDKKQSKKDSFI